MKGLWLLALVLAGAASAIGTSPFRVDAAYIFTGGSVSLGGMYHFSRPLALRATLAELRLSGNTDLAAGPRDVALLYSPGHGKWRVQPYCFAGFGLDYSKQPGAGVNTTCFALDIPLGLGVEVPLLFAPRLPSPFLESRLRLGGKKTTVNAPGDVQGPGSSMFPELKLEQELCIGVRI
jgi:hypothetical protein